MLVHRNGLKVWKAADDVLSGRSLNGVNVRPDGTCEATDGHILVQYRPTVGTDGAEFPDGIGATDVLEDPVIIPAETCKAIGKVACKGLAKRLPDLARNAALATPNGTAPITITDLESPQTFNPTPISGKFPNTDQVIPERTKGTVFSVELLARTLAIMKSIGVESVELQIAGYDEKGTAGPSRIDGTTDDGDVVGVIMPMART